MRHGDKINNLSRTASHRRALLNNLASQLITNKRITTTLAKAKALRTFVEPLITKAKDNTTHQRRIVFSHLQDKEAVKELFDVVRLKVEGRPGGYTRIIKLGTRVGDNAELALIELVDYNEIYGKGVAGQKEITGKRSRRGGGRGKKGATAVAVEGTPSVADAQATSPEVTDAEATSPEVIDATALTDETNSKETPAV
ncbi:MAG: 50S ribosomal protein L17 [Segetibacter sp.]|nr:50S ribosomal protein L17 [Segetibacter sp.]